MRFLTVYSLKARPVWKCAGCKHQFSVTSENDLADRKRYSAASTLNRVILEAMRKGARPMTTLEIVAAVVADLNFGEDAAKGMKSRVRSSLLYLWKVRGAVLKEGERKTARWRLINVIPSR